LKDKLAAENSNNAMASETVALEMQDDPGSVLKDRYEGFIEVVKEVAHEELGHQEDFNRNFAVKKVYEDKTLENLSKEKRQILNDMYNPPHGVEDDEEETRSSLKEQRNKLDRAIQ
jgi:hypothetical protein